MSLRNLVYNFESDYLRIISHDESVLDKEMYVNILNGEVNVMRINGICTSDYKLALTTKTEFNQIVNDYILKFNITEEEMTITTSDYNLNGIHIHETKYELDADLFVFCLYECNIAQAEDMFEEEPTLTSYKRFSKSVHNKNNEIHRLYTSSK
jgi:hypothetical protein